MQDSEGEKKNVKWKKFHAKLNIIRIIWNDSEWKKGANTIVCLHLDSTHSHSILLFISFCYLDYLTQFRAVIVVQTILSDGHRFSVKANKRKWKLARKEKNTNVSKSKIDRAGVRINLNGRRKQQERERKNEDKVKTIDDVNDALPISYSNAFPFYLIT